MWKSPSLSQSESWRVLSIISDNPVNFRQAEWMQKYQLMIWLDKMEKKPPLQTKVLPPFGEHRCCDTTLKFLIQETVASLTATSQGYHLACPVYTNADACRSVLVRNQGKMLHESRVYTHRTDILRDSLTVCTYTGSVNADCFQNEGNGVARPLHLSNIPC